MYDIRVKGVVANTFGIIMYIIRQYRKTIFNPKNAKINIYELIQYWTRSYYLE